MYRAITVEVNGNKLVAFQDSEGLQYFMDGVERFYPILQNQMMVDFGPADGLDYTVITHCGSRWSLVPELNYDALVTLAMLGNTPWRQFKWEEYNDCIGYNNVIGILQSL